jgi:hypothetical protein
VATGDQRQALAEGLAHARALVEQGEVKAALKQAERVRRAALAAEDVPVLEQVLGLARLVREQTDGKRHHEAGRLAYSARENVRFVGRKQALAEGREWIDPFQTPPLAAASDAPPLSEAAGGKTATAPPGAGMLFLHLGASLLFCAAWGVGALFYSTDEVDMFAFSWMGVWGVYWLVMAVLQVRWWRPPYWRTRTSTSGSRKWTRSWPALPMPMFCPASTATRASSSTNSRLTRGSAAKDLGEHWSSRHERWLSASVR